MNVLKGLGIFLLSFIMVILLVSVSITSAVKDVIQNQLLGQAVKEIAIKNAEQNENIDSELVDKVVNYKGTSEIIDAVLDEYIDYVDNGNKEVSDETVDLIINFVVDNKDEIEKVTGEKINVDEVKSEESRDNLRKSLNEGFEKINVESIGPVNGVINSYAKVTSNKYKIRIIIIIIVLALLIGLICWSVYKWMQPIGIVGITSGIIVTLFYFATFALLKVINANADININIDTKVLLITGIIEIVIGIALLVAYSIIDGKIKTKKLYDSLSNNNSNNTVENV